MYDISANDESWDRLAAIIHDVNVSKGFWPEDRNIGEAIALIHSEISEADDAYFESGIEDALMKDDKLVEIDAFAVELADAAIRTLDLGGKFGVSFDAIYGAIEGPMADGSILAVAQDILSLHRSASRVLEDHRKGRMPEFEVGLGELLTLIIETMVAYGYDPLEIINAKVAYNTTRPFLHGKKY